MGMNNELPFGFATLPTLTGSLWARLRDGNLKSGKWTHQDAKNAKNWVFRWKEKIKSSRFLCNAKDKSKKKNVLLDISL